MAPAAVEASDVAIFISLISLALFAIRLLYGSVDEFGTHRWGVIDYIIVTGLSLFVWKLVVRRLLVTGKIATTQLNGPKNDNWLFGHHKAIRDSDKPAKIYQRWALQYGPAYKIGGFLWGKKIVICDSKACVHFYSKETYGYVHTKLARMSIANLFGRGLLWSEGDSHLRQRKALSPAFSNAAIRHLVPVFYDSSYKMKAAWETMLDVSPEQVIDVQRWMNRISLDSIGIAGFGHDFHALDGAHTPVIDIFESFGNKDEGLFSRILFLLGPVFPIVQNVPTERGRLLKKLRRTMGYIADELLERSRAEKEGRGGETDKSIIGLLIKAENADSALGMTQEEILAQMNVLLLAGYETTSISLTWALIELCRNPEKQSKLRAELAEFVGTDPTWEQLSSSLPYLDAVVHEVLRLHPPVTETSRTAAEDDIIPFGEPIRTKSGEILDHLIVRKGTSITAPIAYINQREAFWGSNAAEFEPERWMADEAPGPKDLVAHRHILTFSDGARLCLGRNFALAEFKAVLTVLIRNYAFELPDGPETPIVMHRSIINRPKLVGQKGAVVNMKVCRAE